MTPNVDEGLSKTKINGRERIDDWCCRALMLSVDVVLPVCQSSNVSFLFCAFVVI